MKKLLRRDLLFKIFPAGGAILLGANKLNLLPQNTTPTQPELNLSQSSKPNSSETKLIPEYTFSNFVLTESNKLAYFAAKQIAKFPMDTALPFVIYGPTGIGKTHLLNAIGNELTVTHPNLRVFRTSSEGFLNECIRCIRRGEMDLFRAKYRNFDVLLIEDIQVLNRGESVQEEFFHTFNAYAENRKIILATCDSSVGQIQGLEERIKSRFQGGINIKIKGPSYSEKRMILSHWQKEQKVELPEDVRNYIIGKSGSSVRALQGNFKRIMLASDLLNEPISKTLAKRIFG